MAKVSSDGFVILTGPPCVGKTTLIREAIKKLKNDHNIICNGFYTEELRNDRGERIGFDAVSVADGRRSALARKFYNGRAPHPPKVGRYSIYLSEFNEFISTVLVPSSNLQIMIIDEIGRMELKSHRFEQLVKDLLPRYPMLITLPCNTGLKLPLIQMLRTHDKAVVIEVCEANRDGLLNDLVSAALAVISNRKT